MSTHHPVRALSPLLGRADDMRHLDVCWERARRGDGNAVVISGEAGIGKSRLASELAGRASTHDALVLRFQCSALQSNSDLHPIRDYLAQFAGTQRTEPEPPRHAKIRSVLERLSPGRMPERLLSSLAAMGHPSDQMQAGPVPRLGHSKVLEVLSAGFIELASIKPLLVIFEDAQWLDPTSTALLERLVANSAAQRLLIVVTARRDYDPSWIGIAHTSVVIPRRLNRADALALAQQSAGADALGADDLQHVVTRSEGVPLFVEELSKERTANSAIPADALSIPAGLQALLMARLDKVGPAKRVAQVAAALGRRFSHDIAALAWGGSEPDFEPMIATLMAAEVLLSKPVQRGSHYSFRHALFQDAAYASLLRQQRVAVHADIVRAIAAGARDIVADQPEIMAHHCDRAELALPAAVHWLAAGKASAARGSAILSINAFKFGLAAAQRSAPSDQRDRLEFELNLNLGPALMALKGYACGEGLATFMRARQLLPCSRSSLEEIHVLLGLFNVHFGRGEYVQALDVGHQADQLLSVGYGGYPVLVGQTQCMMGRFPEARRSLEQALAKYDPALDADSGLFCQADVVATSFLAKVEFALGNLDRATTLTRDALNLAQRQRHPLALAIALLGQLFLATEAGDLLQAQTIADAALAHVKRHNLENYRLWVAYHRAALSLRTNPAAAIATMHQLLGEADTAGSLMFRPAQLGLLGAAYAGTGRTAEALSLIDQGLETARQAHGLEVVPALHRLRAKVLAVTHPAAAVEELEVSLAIAGAQSARMEQLRSATVLARLLRETDRRTYARDLLGGIYATFTEGHQFPDLRQANRVLASLGESL